MAGSMEEKQSIDKLDWKQVDGTEVVAEDANEDIREDFPKKSQKPFSTVIMAASNIMV